MPRVFLSACEEWQGCFALHQDAAEQSAKLKEEIEKLQKDTRFDMDASDELKNKIETDLADQLHSKLKDEIDKLHEDTQSIRDLVVSLSTGWPPEAMLGSCYFLAKLSGHDDYMTGATLVHAPLQRVAMLRWK
eukprot:Skav202758  [mRNA]  locus=scaffold326:86193:87947:+ [translate_table: standard]